MLVIVVPLAAITWSGVSAALGARQAYRELQAELSHFTPVDLVQISVYQSLEGRFREAEENSNRARSRLAFLKAFQWVPIVGSPIEEVRILLDIGYFQARAGRQLAVAYRAAISSPLEEMPPDLAADEISRVLREVEPQLNQVREDLRRVAELRQRLGTTERGVSYGILVDRYLPAIQTVAYLSSISPEVIGHTYALSRELTSIQDLAADPLDVIANPDEVGEALSNVTIQSAALERALEVVVRTTRASGTEDIPELAAVSGVLDTLVPGVALLRHATAGARSLVTMAEALESAGFLSKEFGSVAGAALQEAQQELTLAREEVASLQKLLSVQGVDAETFLPSLGFGGDSPVSVSSTERVELVLDEAINASKFLSSFLGFEGRRTYLLIAQNQNEIRATGGFIGIAVEATVDKGELTDLVYHDSTTVDREPLTGNPEAPEGVYWYLWMGRLLFRDANWSPHFPSSAAKVAEIYQRGQGVKVDGVITASKFLSLDLVELFEDITVPGLDGVLTREQAAVYTEVNGLYTCSSRHVSLRGKRCFDEDLFFGLKNRLTTQSIPISLRRRLVELVNNHLDEKNILIHVFPPVDDALLWDQGWNGALSVVDHDYLLVVDSSLPGHSNKDVLRSWEYSVSLEPDEPVRAQLRLRYDNQEGPKDKTCSQFAWDVYHCYWNYFRVYLSPMAEEVQMPPVPLHQGAAKLIWGYPGADSATVLSNSDTGPARLTELGGYVAVEPGSVMTVPVQFVLPPGAVRPTAVNVYEYRLLIQKQPGMNDDRVSLTVDLPPDAELVTTSPAFNSKRRQRIFFDFTLESDTTVVVSFSTNGSG